MGLAKKLKNTLDEIIAEMEETAELYVRNPGKDFTRNRKLPFRSVLGMLIGMEGKSTKVEIYDYFNADVEKIPTHSALVQQRDKILPEAFEYLFGEFNKRCWDKKRWNGKRLFAADGTAVNIAKNANSDTYFENGDKEGYNQFHVNALYDLMNKTYTDCYIQPRPFMNEVEACIKMLERIEFPKDSVLMADRGYGALNLLEHVHRKKNLDYLIRVKNNFLSEFRDMPMKKFDKDLEIELRTTRTKEDIKAYKDGKAKYISGKSRYGKNKKDVSWDFESPCKMKLRVVRFEIADGVYETIVTSLDRWRFPIRKIKEAYHLRWGIETSFRELKYAIGLTHFHAKKEDSIIQEIYARMIMYNYCERITLHVVIKQSDKRTHLYQVNFTMAIHICRYFYRFQGQGKAPPDPETAISNYINPVREGRHDARKIRTQTAESFLYLVA